MGTLRLAIHVGRRERRDRAIVVLLRRDKDRTPALVAKAGEATWRG